VYRIELVPVKSRILHSVGLMELERVVLLRLYVHAHNVKSCPVVAHSRSSRATEQVE
jgi:hypothetical protein